MMAKKSVTLHFDLAPLPIAARAIGGASALRDDALQAHLAGGAQGVFALATNLVGELQGGLASQ
jgi:hypothetical protein